MNIDINRLKDVYKFDGALGLEDIQVLLSVAKSKRVKKKELLINEGSLENSVYYIQKGLVRSYFINDKGEEITFNLIPEYHMVYNTDYILYEKPSKFYYETLEDCDLLELDYAEMDDIVADHPKLEKSRKYVQQKLLQYLRERIEYFVLLTPEERYINFLSDHPNINDRVPDKYIANVLGITPVSLSRIRKRIAQKK